ncbi:hypothetical protein [Bradyrhizobium liaoningense]|uniref:hypothetical protein n=1 Tax=Bradyrhizobium liaoningense TaxID=43992 RepID=UPI001BAE3232|nr:hypothetical protein [Bradyrhizobium liaoningense]MBR0855452.1 hypothetical protein [Bradyrhizobium liaoningense]
MLDSFESLARSPFGAMAKKKTVAPVEQLDGLAKQSERLKQLRKTLGYSTASAFSNFLELGYTTYHPFEKGQPLSREAAFRIVRKIPGITLDWLYFGKPDGLPLELARRLGVFGKTTTD